MNDQYIWLYPELVLESSNGYLWFRSTNGISWFDPSGEKWCWVTNEKYLNPAEGNHKDVWMESRASCTCIQSTEPRLSPAAVSLSMLRDQPSYPIQKTLRSCVRPSPRLSYVVANERSECGNLQIAKMEYPSRGMSFRVARCLSRKSTSTYGYTQKTLRPHLHLRQVQEGAGLKCRCETSRAFGGTAWQPLDDLQPDLHNTKILRFLRVGDCRVPLRP